jgi:hypothetical protein
LFGEKEMKRLLIVCAVLSITCISANVSNSAEYWAKTYGWSNHDYAYSIQQTTDGGYIVAGETYSFGVDSAVIWILKLDSNGDITWQKTYGGSGRDYADFIQQTTDGGYIVVGNTSSFGGGSPDIWILKIDSNGDITWQKTYGGSDWDRVYSIQQASDGGYIAAGYTHSFGVSSSDSFLLKLDSNGDITWQKTYGGSNSDRLYSVRQTTDGGYIVAGRTQSFGAGEEDFWVLKIDSNGDITWQKTYGGSNHDYSYSTQQTTDGGYIVAGYTYSFGVGSSDGWLLKLDSNGDITWQKTYGGDNSNRIYSIQQTSDGGYIVAGVAGSFYHSAYSDSWAFKLDGSGNIVWENIYYGGLFDDTAQSIEQTTDGGYILTGSSIPSGTRSTRVLKLNNNGLIPDCDIANTTSAIITDTSVVAQDTTATIQTTSAVVTVTDVTPQDTMSEIHDCPPMDYDNDGTIDIEDNCPEDYNPSQEDTYPPQGNGIGDACDCEANFDCNCGVDALDVSLFLVDMGRNQYFNPCTNDNPCNGDFACDGAVDATDVVKFLEDFGR